MLRSCDTFFRLYSTHSKMTELIYVRQKFIGCVRRLAKLLLSKLEKLYASS